MSSTSFGNFTNKCKKFSASMSLHLVVASSLLGLSFFILLHLGFSLTTSKAAFPDG